LPNSLYIRPRCVGFKAVGLKRPTPCAAAATFLASDICKKAGALLPGDAVRH
jgi:hypothetical protein